MNSINNAEMSSENQVPKYIDPFRIVTSIPLRGMSYAGFRISRIFG